LATITVSRPSSVRRVVGLADAGEDVAGLAAQVEGQAQQLVGALDRRGLGDAGDAQVEPGEGVEVDGVGDGVLAPGGPCLDAGFAAGGGCGPRAARSSFEASSMASICFCSTRVISGLNLLMS
jgi:hypothetical protein